MISRNTWLALLGGSTLALGACGGGSSGGGTPAPTPSVSPTPPPSTAACDEAFVSCAGNVATLSGTITKDFTLDPSLEWRLDNLVKVGEGNVEISSEAQATAIKAAGVTLTVPAGSDVKALDDAILLVTRGSRLIADGTRTQPITFSSIDADFDGEGEWGGVVIQGFAPQFGAGGTGVCHGNATSYCNVDGEGGPEVAKYGGNDPADDSGIVRYVRIAEGGLVAGPNNEVNGLTLQGVGHSTIVDYVHVHGNLDDGVEWFGGTVNATHLVLTNNDDDDIDFDEGFKGNIQFAIVQKNQTKLAPTGSNDPRGIEANSSDDEFVPETEATLANVSVIGGPVSNNADAGQQPGMRLRGALTVSIYNSAVKSFDTGCIRIDDADTDGDNVNDQFSSVSLINVFGDCADGFYDKRDADTQTNVGAETITFDEAYAINEGFAAVGATNPVATDNGSGFAFAQTDYVGAVAPGTTPANAWWAGWVLPGTLSDISEEPQAASFVSCTATTCTVTGTIDEDYTFVGSRTWVLDGLVKVGNGNVEITSEAQADQIKADGVTLTIRPGVNVLGLDDGILLVTRGSRLIADGSASAPITFSSADAGFDGEGEWGGVVIQGFAPQFGAGGTGVCHGNATSYCNVDGEGGPEVAKYGGNDPADNSGIVRYVRIAEGGLVAGPNNEVNGLTLQGVGHGTRVDYVQVHANLDDGVEWFGGTVNATHLVLTGNDDDDIDFDEGFKGNIQYAIIQKNQSKTAPTGSNDPRGIEANSSDDEFVPETEATLANVLVLGGPVNNNATAGQQPGMRLRGALTVSIFNTAVRDFDTGCIRIDDADTNGDDTVDVLSNVTLTNVLGSCADGFYDKRNADSENGAVGASAVTLDGSFAITEPAAVLGVATTIPATDNGSGFSFDNTAFIGAVAPGTAAGQAWWSGWILEGTLQ